MNHCGNECVVGIDPSLTGFAMVAMYYDGSGKIESKELKTKATDTLKGRMDRLRRLAKEAEAFIKKHWPALCVIEGYSHAAKWKAAAMGELGAMVRHMVIGIPPVTIEVAPTVLKKFAAGKGNANKLVMTQSVGKKFDCQFKTDNMADAYGLAWLGLVGIDKMEATNQKQREVIKDVKKLILRETE